MIVYQTDDQGVYLGPTEADESPLEPGVFLLPKGTVEAPPPLLLDRERARWDWENMWWVLEEVPAPELPPGYLPVWSEGAWHAQEAPRLPEVPGLEQYWTNGAWAYRRKVVAPIPPMPEVRDDQIALLVDNVWQVYDVAPAEEQPAS